MGEELARREPLSFGSRLAIAAKRVFLTIVLLVLVGLGFAGAYVLYQTYQQPQPIQPTLPVDDTLANDYQQALAYMEQGQWDQAVSLLDEILAVAPDYEDAAEKKAEALEKQELTRLYDQGKAHFDQGEWDEAIAQWRELRNRDPSFNKASVEDMLCQAYLEKGLLDVAAFDKDSNLRHLHEAVVDFGQGSTICPDAADLQADLEEEKQLASLYLDANVAYGTNWDEAIAKLNVIRELRADYGQVKERLYRAYVNRGDAYVEEERWELALADYELALGLEVSDESMAEDKRDALKEKMDSLSVTPTPTRGIPTQVVPTPRPTATPTRIAIKYPAPKLVRPDNRMSFATALDPPVLEWEPVGELASDEYYSVMVVHFHSGNDVYWTSGLIKETQVQLPVGAGYDEADQAEFYWWVTVHRATKTTPDSKPDGPPISRESEHRMFRWD